MKPTTKKAKIGIIGAGAMGRKYLNLCDNMKEVELVGIYDINPTNFTNTKNYTDLDKIIADSEGLVIASSTNSHYSIAKKVILSGKHCLIEKPISTDTKEATELVELAKKHKAKIQVGHVERFNPAFNELLKVLKTKKNISVIDFSRLSYNVNRSNEITVVMDLMIHDIDLMLAILKNSFDNLSTEPTIKASGIVKHNSVNHVNAMLSYDDELMINLAASRITHATYREIRILTDTELIVADLLAKNINIFRSAQNSNSSEYRIERNIDRIFVPQSDALNMQILNFVDIIINPDEQPVVSAQEAIEAVKVAQAIEACVQ